MTADRPKAMIEVDGLTLLDRQVAAFRRQGIEDIVVVTGYRPEAVQSAYPVHTCLNDRFETTNMVYSLFCANEFLTGDTIISYGDILYEDTVLESLLEDPHSISVVVDLEWMSYYKERFTDPYDDAESLTYASDLRLLSIGKANPAPEEVMGQYIGLVKVSAAGVAELQQLRQKVKHTPVQIGWGRPYPIAYMTDFLQELINRDIPVHAVPIRRGWFEIDLLSDYELVLKSLRS